MDNILSIKQPLNSKLWCKQNKYVRNIILLLLGVGLISLGAHISVLLTPVPITLQTFFVLLIGMTYGWRLGLATVVAYLALGLTGLPVFALGILGPTSGYLIGFLPAVLVSGFLVENGWGKYFLSVLIASLIATTLIYFCGLANLSLFVGWHKAIDLGLFPFILIDIAKILALALIVPKLWCNK